MELNEIKDFLREKPGYLKKGSGQLAVLLEADVEKCKTALREVRKEFSYPKEDSLGCTRISLPKSLVILSKSSCIPTSANMAFE